MKKLILLLFIPFVFACSDDTSGENNNLNYSAELESDCGDNNTRVSHCISEEQYNWIDQNVIVGEPCWYITITDLEGNSQSGYLRSWGLSSCGT